MNWDKLVSSYILFGENSSENKKRWTIEKLQMYINLIGPRHMEMTKSANTILQQYYLSQRKSVYRDPSRTTVRMLNSLVRLSQAHCRLMYRTIILPVDAIMAVSLVDLSMQDCTISDTVDALHSTFKKYPDFEYLCMAKKLLTQLNLFEIWQEELLYYAKLLRIDNKTLENEIENRHHAIFAQVDDVEDSNIPLSANLVNNSYFNNKKDEKENQKDAINSKLAATFVKHAALNKNERIPEVHKKNTKRMRKEVVLNKNGLQNETKRIKRKKYIKQKVQVNDSENEDFDVNKALNAVPSVNDVFNDLGMDFNIANNLDVLEDIDGKPNDLCNDLEIVEAKLTNNSSMNNIHTKEIEDSTRKKLKQFQFTSKSDIGRHNDETVKQVSESNTVIGKSSSNSSENKTVGTSQTIIFESGFDSDWDI